MSLTLLQKAKQVSSNARMMNVSEEMIELAIAWGNDQVGNKQVQKAVGLRSVSEVYRVIAIALREAMRQGKISEVKSQKK